MNIISWPAKSEQSEEQSGALESRTQQLLTFQAGQCQVELVFASYFSASEFLQTGFPYSFSSVLNEELMAIKHFPS